MFSTKLYHNCDVYTNEAQKLRMLNTNGVSEFVGLAKLVDEDY